MALEITYLGHAGFLLNDGQHALVIDPFLTGNPLAKHTPEQIRCQLIALTHGHEDHLGDTISIAKANNATVVASHEISLHAEENGCQAIGTNPGSRVVFDFGWVAFTQAWHSSSYGGRYMGIACGLVVQMAGARLYHCGDTDLFSDMKLIAEIYKPDIACIPIGDRYTMGPELASRAAEWIKPKVAIPIHFKTFPVLLQDASDFKPAGVEVKVLEPGENFSYG